MGASASKATVDGASNMPSRSPETVRLKEWLTASPPSLPTSPIVSFDGFNRWSRTIGSVGFEFSATVSIRAMSRAVCSTGRRGMPCRMRDTSATNR
ncbi:hypothetical protein D9M72_648510 [compost metagenome]